MFREFSDIFLILDALDECADRTQVIPMLQKLVGELKSMHIMVTSRRERDIDSLLESFVSQQHWICLQSSLVNEDIRRYIQHRWHHDIGFRRWKADTEIRKEVEVSLMHKAEGM
jgi:hypothetical protein